MYSQVKIALMRITERMVRNGNYLEASKNFVFDFSTNKAANMLKAFSEDAGKIDLIVYYTSRELIPLNLD
jgi:hypothetical protein